MPPDKHLRALEDNSRAINELNRKLVAFTKLMETVNDNLVAVGRLMKEQHEAHSDPSGDGPQGS